MAKALVLIPYRNDEGIEIESKPLVLCCDCKWYKDNGESADHWLPCQDMTVPEHWFCASGEEK